MLAKCSNPSCSSPFLRLKEGSLFRLEPDGRLRICERPRVEYFWLCDDCSQDMTLRLGSNGAVVNVVLSSAPLPIDRREGWLLRSVKDPSSENPVEASRSKYPAGFYGV